MDFTRFSDGIEQFSDGIGILAFVFFIFLAFETIRQFRPCLSAMNTKLASQEDTGSEDFEPQVQILLCLRGKDPFLMRCLGNLANQAYTNYRVSVILDSKEDEAYDQVKELMTIIESSRFDIMVRDRLYSTCSRRACSVLTGLSQLSDDVEIVVMCDGDAMPSDNWLRELVANFNDPSVLATSGNRWYAPPTPNLGSQLRYFWNALAVPSMFTHGIPWAGSMAIHRSLFNDPKFLESIQQAFSEDTQLAAFLTTKGIRVRPMPELPIVNEETVSLSSFWGFLIRQLIAARVHHPKWSLVLGHGIILGFAAWVLLPLSIIAGPTAIVGWITGYLTFGIIVHILVRSYDLRVRQLVEITHESSHPPYSRRRILVTLPIGTLTMFLYPIAVLQAALLKTHVWRGISYRISNAGIIAIDTHLGEGRTVEEYEAVEEFEPAI